jgi:hypothetical protein
MGMSPPKGVNLGSKQQPSQDPGHLLAALIVEMIQTDGLPTKLEETLVLDHLLNGAGRSEALAIVSEIQEVQAVNDDAKRDLGKLRLQAVTRCQVRISTENLVLDMDLSGTLGIDLPALGMDLPGLLIKLITKHQEQDLYCKWIAGQLFYPCWQPNLALAQLGPGWDDYTVQQFPGGTKDLLCVAHYVIMPVQTSLCIELLCQFHDCLIAGH